MTYIDFLLAFKSIIIKNWQKLYTKTEDATEFFNAQNSFESCLKYIFEGKWTSNYWYRSTGLIKCDPWRDIIIFHWLRNTYYRNPHRCFFGLYGAYSTYKSTHFIYIRIRLLNFGWETPIRRLLIPLEQRVLSPHLSLLAKVVFQSNRPRSDTITDKK